MKWVPICDTSNDAYQLQICLPAFVLLIVLSYKSSSICFIFLFMSTLGMLQSSIDLPRAIIVCSDLWMQLQPCTPLY
jgi:hypothetical protein